MARRRKSGTPAGTSKVSGNRAGVVGPGSPLEGHIKDEKGKVFTPPLAKFLQEVNGSKDGGPFVDWVAKLLPELVWIRLLLDSLANETVVAIVAEMVVTTRKVNALLQPLPFASAFRVAEPNRATFLASLDSRSLMLLSASLAPLVVWFPDYPLEWLVTAEDRSNVCPPDALKLVEKAILGMHDRRGDAAVEVERAAYRAMVQAGVIVDLVGLMDRSRPQEASGEQTDDIESIAAEIGGGPFHAFMISITAADLGDVTRRTSGLGGAQEGWQSDFWRRGRAEGRCPIAKDSIGRLGKGMAEDFTESDTKRFFQNWMLAGNAAIEATTKEASLLWSRLDSVCVTRSAGRVLTALLARQVEFANYLCMGPPYSAAPFGEIVLRCMAETLIRVGYLVGKSDDALFVEFIEYGEGREKQEILRNEAREEPAAGSEGQEKLETRRRLAAEAKLLELRAVDTGGGSHGSNLREMAKTADLLSVYQRYFEVHSGAVHGQWQWLLGTNIAMCRNPMHGGHLVPLHNFSSTTRPEFVEDALRLYELLRLQVLKHLGESAPPSGALAAWKAGWGHSPQQ